MEAIVTMVFGSHLYGTNGPASDKDYKGVFLPERRDVLLQRVPRSLRQSTKKGDNAKNTPDDVESEHYSLNYFVHLACEGETVALDMLHAPDRFHLESSPIWRELCANRRRFYTRNLKAFVGYARRQAAKYGVKGSRLAEAKRVLVFLEAQPLDARVADVWEALPAGEHIFKTANEVDKLYDVCGKKLNSRSYCRHHVSMLRAFVDRYGERAKQAEANEGIDWKAVSHAFRAAYQVKHILLHDGYTYPLPETDELRAVKAGQMDWLSEVGPRLDALMDELERLSEQSTLPRTVDRAYWDGWLADTLDREVFACGEPL
jgi:hypothetical protein